MRDPYSVFQSEHGDGRPDTDEKTQKLGLIGRALEGVALVALFFALVMTLATTGARANPVALAQATEAHTPSLLAMVSLAFVVMALALRQVWRITVKGIHRGAERRF